MEFALSGGPYVKIQPNQIVGFIIAIFCIILTFRFLILWVFNINDIIAKLEEISKKLNKFNP